MEVIVYGCRTSKLLLVPSCMLPSIEAQHMYGPMLPRGRLVFDENAAEWQTVVGRIDRHAYALLSQREAKRLLGGGCLGAVPERPSEGAAMAELGVAARGSS